MSLTIEGSYEPVLLAGHVASEQHIDAMTAAIKGGHGQVIVEGDYRPIIVPAGLTSTEQIEYVRAARGK